MARSSSFRPQKLPSGRWRVRWFAPDGTRPGQTFATEAAARAFLRRVQVEADDIRAGLKAAPNAAADLTFSDYADRWLAARVSRVRSHATDVTNLAHARPALGHLKLIEIQPATIRDLVLELRSAGEFAPRTIRHVYGSIRGVFRSAQIDGLIAASPCVLEAGTLPPNVDRDPTWRATAVFSRDELEALISDERVPHDRRVLYALFGLGGLRLSEAAGLRWEHLDGASAPLARLFVNQSYGRPGTKTGASREVPVHATLAEILSVWKRSGWASIYGRHPKPDDLVVPTRRFGMRNAKDCTTARERDLARLGIRHRRGHDLRRTFISLAQVDGAVPHILERVTHGPRGDILNQYTTYPWASLCREVAKLKVAPPRAADVIRLAAS
jgi:integrase